MSGIRRSPIVARFLLDADVNPDLAFLLRPNGHDVLLTNEASRHNATDDEQLLLATDLGCILITHDKTDYLLLVRLWRRLAERWGVSPEPHASILVLPQSKVVPYQRSASEVDMILASRDDLSGRILRFDTRWGWEEIR